MIKKTLTLCTLATLTLFAQAQSDHLHEALKQINKNETAKQNNKAIKYLLEHCEHEAKKKKQTIKRNLYWGIGRGIAGFCAFVISCKIEDGRQPNKSNRFSIFLRLGGIYTAIRGANDLCSFAIDYFKHNKEYTNEIEAIEKALAAIKTKNNQSAPQSNIEEA